MKSRGELEAEITQAVIRFEKEYMGRGPLEARSYLVDDLVVVRLKNVLTPAEHKLAASPDPARGRDRRGTVVGGGEGRDRDGRAEHAHRHQHPHRRAGDRLLARRQAGGRLKNSPAAS